MAESKLQARIISDTKGRGGLACKIIPFFLVGIPDLLLALPGTGMFLVEVKDGDNGALSKVQKERIAFVRSLGINVFVIRTIMEWVECRNTLLQSVIR